jgi:ABC-type Mn2+/Zn2+ transport system permease subunit
MTAAILPTVLEPWSHGFMQRAFLELVLIGVVGGVLGCWVVLYELSYSAESLAHALLPGLVVAALLGLPLIVGGAVGVLAAAVAVALAGRIPEIGGDTAVAVVITGLFGLGVVLALSPDAPPGLNGLLFGDLLGVSQLDLAYAGALAAVALAALVVLHRLLLAVGFERSNARLFGASPLVADIGLLVLVAVAILIGVQALGNLLVVAVIVGPAATARLFARRMASIMVLAAAIAIAASATGLYLSYYASTAAGASVAGALVGFYLVGLAVRVLSGAGTRSGFRVRRSSRASAPGSSR